MYMYSKRLDTELTRRGHDIPNKVYPDGYQEAPLAYDAVWSVALAFNRTMERLARKDKKRSLKDFTYTDAEIANEIYAAMNSTSFLGVSVSRSRSLVVVSYRLLAITASISYIYIYSILIVIASIGACVPVFFFSLILIYMYFMFEITVLCESSVPFTILTNQCYYLCPLKCINIIYDTL